MKRALTNYLFPAPAPSSLAISSGVWGDGFDGDNFVSLSQARRVDDIADDELVRVFPRLIGCSAMRERLLARLGRWLNSIRSLDSNQRETRVSKAATHGEIESLSQLHCNMRNGCHDDYDDGVAEALAFGVCAHPVYLWPAALGSHQLYTTIAWLGLLNSGRSCLMTPDVAEYVCENIEIDGTRVTAHPSLERRVGSPRALSLLLSRAEDRLNGRRNIIFSPNPYVSDFARLEGSCQ